MKWSQEHALLFVEQLLDAAARDVPARVQPPVDRLDQFTVVIAVRGRVIVEADAEGPEIAFVLLVHQVDEFFG
jgi:hypothetical protein